MKLNNRLSPHKILFYFQTTCGLLKRKISTQEKSLILSGQWVFWRDTMELISNLKCSLLNMQILYIFSLNEEWASLILRCFYVITIKCKRHLDVTMLSSYEVVLLDFVIFHLGRLFLHLARWKYCRIKDAHTLKTFLRNVFRKFYNQHPMIWKMCSIKMNWAIFIIEWSNSWTAFNN